MHQMLRFPGRAFPVWMLLAMGFFGLLTGWLAALAARFVDPGLGVLLAVGALASACLLTGRLAPHRVSGPWRKPKALPALPGNASTVLVEVNELWQPGVLIERSISGMCVVYVPATFQPLTGSVYVVPPHKLQPLDMPLPELTAALRRFGRGMSSRVTTPFAAE